MRRLALIAAALLCYAALFSQTSDAGLIRQADFSGQLVSEAPPDGADCAERAHYLIRKQLAGRDAYDPPTYMFFRQAVRQIGFVPAVLATSDRLLRDTRIGTAGVHLNPDDPFIHEGPEAYALRRKCPVAVPSDSLRLAASDSLCHFDRDSLCHFDRAQRVEKSKDVSTPLDMTRKFVSADYEFVNYLIDNDMKQGAKALLFREAYAPSDTLDYLRGWALYQLKELEPACCQLGKLNTGSPFYDRAFFYSNAISAHLGNYDAPVAALEAYSGPYVELKGLQLAGLALLRDDPDAFKAAAAEFSYGDFALERAEHELDNIFAERYLKPQKSPWLAAAASAVVPGLGKIYAGQLGEGISTFLITGVCGAITAEHWVKDGISSWKTIVPAALTAVLYIGNIYGSYMSVSIYNNRLKDAQETAVLYNIHIPLRAVFK